MVPLTSEGERQSQSRGWEQLREGRGASREGHGLTRQSSGSKDRRNRIQRKEKRRVG